MIPELKEMAQMELENCFPRKKALIAKIEVLLIPKDPNDDHDCIVEIRGAAGGDEGKYFSPVICTGCMCGMRKRRAGKSRCWKMSEIGKLAASPMISFLVKGDEVYRQLKI